MPSRTILGIYEWPKPGQCGTIICVFKLGFRLLSKSQSSVWQFSKRESGINVAFWKDTRLGATNRSAAVVFLNQIPLDWSSLTHTFLIWTYHIEMSAAKTIKFGFPKHKTTTNKQIFRRSNVLWLLEQKHFSDRIHNHSLQHDNCGREIFGIRESEIGRGWMNETKRRVGEITLCAAEVLSLLAVHRVHQRLLAVGRQAGTLLSLMCNVPPGFIVMWHALPMV